jgi:Holliday junction resolvase RusA-like endonuclease
MCGGSRPWDSQKKVKLACGIALAEQHAYRPFFEGPLHFDVCFYFPFPQIVSRAKIPLLRGKPHICRPDLSNLLKFVEDIGTGILYSDDCLISSITAKKCYDDKPRTEFSVTQVQSGQ